MTANSFQVHCHREQRSAVTRRQGRAGNCRLPHSLTAPAHQTQENAETTAKSSPWKPGHASSHCCCCSPFPKKHLREVIQGLQARESDVLVWGGGKEAQWDVGAQVSQTHPNLPRCLRPNPGRPLNKYWQGHKCKWNIILHSVESNFGSFSYLVPAAFRNKHGC